MRTDVDLPKTDEGSDCMQGTSFYYSDPEGYYQQMGCEYIRFPFPPTFIVCLPIPERYTGLNGQLGCHIQSFVVILPAQDVFEHSIASLQFRIKPNEFKHVVLVRTMNSLPEKIRQSAVK
jgi:hypothetical protein